MTTKRKYSVASKFTAENIAAIIRSAKDGGRIDEVVQRSGVDLSSAAVRNWLNAGKKDSESQNVTAYAVFSDVFNKIYKSSPWRLTEEQRKDEMLKALSILSEEANDTIWEQMREKLG